MFDWYFIFNKHEFIATELVQRTVEKNLQDRGMKTFNINNGNLISISDGDTILPLGLDGMNPYESNDKAVYEDEDGNVYFGYRVE